MNSVSLSKQILDVLPKGMRNIRNEMRQSANGQLTVAQFRVLVKLAKGPTSHKAVAEWLGITPATLTRMIDTLVERKLVQRQIDPEDRRQTILQVTGRGRKQYERLQEKAQISLQERMEFLSESEKNILAQGLDVLSKLFQD